MNSSSNQSLIKSTDRKVSMPIGAYSEIEMFQVANFYPVIELNIKKIEFGNESLWLRLPPKNGKPGNTVKRLSFVLV